MSIEKIKQFIKDKTIIGFTWNNKLWGILTCMSDDETCVYYKRCGVGWFYGCTIIESIMEIA